MAFSKQYRRKLIDECQHRFKCYWHAIHPVVFNPNDLYRLAFSTEEWDAMSVLRERYKETLRTGYHWDYVINEVESPGTEADLEKVNLRFSTDDHLPQIELNERDIPERLAKRIAAWGREAKRLDYMESLLREKLGELVHLEFQEYDCNNRKIERAIVNTPGTMHRVWPEILPFLDNQSRNEMTQKSMKSPMPKHWDNADYCEFHEGKEMEELTEALIAMALLPNEYDNNYPEIY